MCASRCRVSVSLTQPQLHDPTLYFAERGRVVPEFRCPFKRAFTDVEKKELDVYVKELKTTTPLLPDRQQLWTECRWRGACYRASPALKAPEDCYRRDPAVVVRWDDSHSGDGSKYYGQIRFFFFEVLDGRALSCSISPTSTGSARAPARGPKFRTSVPDQRLVAIDEILGKIILIPKGKELVVVDTYL